MSRKELEKGVYSMSAFRDLDVDAALPEDENFDGEDEISGQSDDGRPPPDVPSAETDDHPVVGQMLCDFYSAAFAASIGSFFSIQGGEGSRERRLFQLLAFKTASSVVRTFRTRKKWECRMSVQWLDLWADRSTSDKQLADVIAMQDPEYVELRDCIRSFADRQHVHKWTEVQSDTDGCIALQRPELVQVHAQLNTRTIPVLCLLDALQTEGFALAYERIVHKPDDIEKKVDARKMSSSRHYYQCILARHALWRRGVPEIRSGNAGTFYWCLLHDKPNDQQSRKRQAASI